MMAARMMPVVRANVANAGGVAREGVWVLPPPRVGSGVALNPLTAAIMRSANNRVRAEGGVVTATASAVGSPPVGRGVASPAAFADGRESNFNGEEEVDSQRWYFSSEGSGASTIEMTVLYDRPVEASIVRVMEGDHFAGGGRAEGLTVMLRVGQSWVPAFGAWNTGLSTSPFQVLDLVLEQAVQVTGVRVAASCPGTSGFVTCAEVDVLATEPLVERTSFDRDSNQYLNIDDLYSFEANPADLDGDSVVGPADREYLLTALRAGSGPR
jgi:hypothetical protein